jgi:NitT/TauT family transport system permease protein
MSEISRNFPASAPVAPRRRRQVKKAGLPSRGTMVALQIALLVAAFATWFVLVKVNILPVFFFGDPVLVLQQIVDWVVTGEVFVHLATTLAETILGFLIGIAFGVGGGLWLGLSPLTAALLDPYIKAFNAMPRVVLGPIFIVWFGLGITSKVVLGVTLVFFVVFFNVFQGVREVSPVVLANARMLGASRSQLLRTVYIPSAMSWVFSSLHMSVGMAFVGAVIGEYLGSSRGIGYLILQAESTFDVNAVFAGILVLTVFALLLDTSVTLVERRLIVGRPT